MRPTRIGLASLAGASLLALVMAVLPAAEPALSLPPSITPAQVLAAGDELEVATSARYEVDAPARRVHVTVDLEAVNRKPVTTKGGVVTRYRYEAVTLAMPPEAGRIRASQDGTARDPGVTRRDGYKVVSVPFRSPLYFGDHASLTVTFDLPAGKPRSSSGIRIGSAFLSFPVWAYGDRGAVRVVVPSPYTVATRGRELEAATSPKGATILTASTDKPLAWHAFVDATDDSALASKELALDGGQLIRLQGWPEDAKWRRVAGRTLAGGIPELQRRIGLPWPVAGTLTVTEVHTPLLEGYAGLYDRAQARITIGEQLDRLTMLHEVSHAWFNGGLFTERWITEGLAEEYAARVLRAQGVETAGPPKVKRGAKGSFALGVWPAPSAIGDQAAVRREQFGYAASWTVVRRVVEAAGEEGMRRVFAAAAAGTTAYPGSGPAEASALPNDWRRLVDLAEELGGASGIASLVAAWALPPDAAPPLEARSEARAAYRDLVGRGGTWAPPAVVRAELDAWRFDDAQEAIAAASAALEARDALAGEASAAGLALPTTLQAAYESAGTTGALDAIAAGIDDARAVLPALAAAAASEAAPRDWLADLGLGDEEPAASLQAARDAWAAGDVAAARAQAEELSARLEDASDAGASRLAAIAVVPAIGALLLLVAGVVVGARRRRA
jgi:hypothetical protein